MIVNFLLICASTGLMLSEAAQMSGTFRTPMVNQLGNHCFPDKRVHLCVVCHYQVREGNVGLTVEVLGKC